MEEKILQSLQQIIDEIKNLNEQSKLQTEAILEQNEYFTFINESIQT